MYTNFNIMYSIVNNTLSLMYKKSPVIKTWTHSSIEVGCKYLPISYKPFFDVVRTVDYIMTGMGLVKLAMGILMTGTELLMTAMSHVVTATYYHTKTWTR